MAAMTSFHAEKCCQLVNEHEVCAGSYAAASDSSWSIVHSYLFLYSALCLREGDSVSTGSGCAKSTDRFTAALQWTSYRTSSLSAVMDRQHADHTKPSLYHLQSFLARTVVYITVKNRVPRIIAGADPGMGRLGGRPHW